MPELPDIELYIQALAERIEGQNLQKVRIGSPFLLRTASPPINEAEGKRVLGVKRLGKRIVLCLDTDFFLVLHLMIAGRLQWKPPGAGIAGKNQLAAFDFASGTLILTESGSKRRASLHLLQGSAALSVLDPGGLEVLGCTFLEFRQALQRENHTLKRSLTDPRIFSGIGNAYSDEILFEARLSPLALSSKLDSEESERLYRSTIETLRHWQVHLKSEWGHRFPEKVTAFHPGMSVHDRYGQPCLRCGNPIQRIRYADNETNYCPTCQTGGRLLSDRSLSRLLGKDWPKSIEALENLTARHRTGSN